jgi:hypothetical protein
MNEPDRISEGKPDVSPSTSPEIVTDSVTLTRLLEEVRNGNARAPGAYDRVHNRHNR